MSQLGANNHCAWQRRRDTIRQGVCVFGGKNWFLSKVGELLTRKSLMKEMSNQTVVRNHVALSEFHVKQKISHDCMDHDRSYDSVSASSE